MRFELPFETPAAEPSRSQSSRRVWLRSLERTAAIVAILAVAFLALYHLTSFPTTWFDEGSHLHVPKTLVLNGVYADFSSEGYRYYGPTIGVGPTVMLPIALAFKLFGIGLLQARAVMVLYMLATIFAFYRLSRQFGNRWLAVVATAVLVSSRAIAFLETGRQVLGEVPGLLFVIAFLAVWFRTWQRPTWGRLALAGILLGLGAITKYQYLLVLAPALTLAWLANLAYYRTLPQRVYFVPAFIGAACFLIWQAYLVLYLGPSTAAQNLALLRQAAAGAAAVFSPALMKRSLGELLNYQVYAALLLPVLIYGFILSVPRRRDAQLWGILFLILMVNLVWYVVASISWVRYVFLGLALGSLLVARFFADLTDGFHFNLASTFGLLRRGLAPTPRDALSTVAGIWLVALVAVPLAQTARQILFPPPNTPLAMAAYMERAVPPGALVETWEPEMGFLTNHNYHFPPAALLNVAVAHQWLGGPSPAQDYHFVETNMPDYVLVGQFATYINLYPIDWLARHYTLVTEIGAYQLYKRSAPG